MLYPSSQFKKIITFLISIQPHVCLLRHTICASNRLDLPDKEVGKGWCCKTWTTIYSVLIIDTATLQYPTPKIILFLAGLATLTWNPYALKNIFSFSPFIHYTPNTYSPVQSFSCVLFLLWTEMHFRVILSNYNILFLALEETKSLMMLVVMLNAFALLLATSTAFCEPGFAKTVVMYIILGCLGFSGKKQKNMPNYKQIIINLYLKNVNKIAQIPRNNLVT